MAWVPCRVKTRHAHLMDEDECICGGAVTAIIGHY